MDKEIIKICFRTLGVVILIFYFFPQMEGALGIETSKCDRFTNSTSSRIKYIFGKCYLPTYSHYETNVICRGGFIGIGQSCFESSETHYESVRGYRCVIAKTGEPC